MVLSYESFHPVYLINVEQRHAAADSHTKTTDLGCESACNSIAIYYYSAQS